MSYEVPANPTGKQRKALKRAMVQELTKQFGAGWVQQSIREGKLKWAKGYK